MTKNVTLNIEGMTCDRCVDHVSEALRTVTGVEAATVDNWANGHAVITTASATEAAHLITAVNEAGYHATEATTDSVEHADSRSDTAAESESNAYELVIIGGGSAAFAAALKTSELGGRAVIINDGLPIGGTCVNVGCVPSKTMIRAAETAHRARETSFDGISVASEVTDFGLITRQAQALVADLRESKYVAVVRDDPNIVVVEGRARIESPHRVEVNGQTLAAKNILIATGARTFVPDIPGVDDIGYLTNEDLYRLDELPEHLIVLGGRYIALENAQAFARLGSRVTLLQRSTRILPAESPDITDRLTEYLREDGVDVNTGVTTTAVRRDGNAVVVETVIDGATELFTGSHLFVATGRRGNTEDLGLDALGLQVDEKGFLVVDKSLRTKVPAIFGAGDVIGEEMFVYTAAYEGTLAAQNAMQNFHLPRDYRVLPWVVFTDPQVAGIGMDEKQAESAGIKFETSILDLKHVPRSIAARDTRGLIKLLRDSETDRLIGARILAPEGSELLMEIALAIKYGVTVKELTSMFHPYLTLSEGVKLAAITFGKDVNKLSCCAV